MSEQESKSIFEVSDRELHFVEFEFRDGSSDSFPYFSLKQVHFESLGGKKKSEVILLYFDQGSVEISGENLLKIKTLLKRNILEFLRIGQCPDPNDPMVSRLAYFPNKQFVEKN